MPFNQQAKRVVEGALRESVRCGHTHIGTEDVLLALVAEADCVAAAILRELGADEQTLRSALNRAA
jgi:ATP-dependent Clp protease ATP-binding subunit ClpA